MNILKDNESFNKEDSILIQEFLAESKKFLQTIESTSTAKYTNIHDLENYIMKSKHYQDLCHTLESSKAHSSKQPYQATHIKFSNSEAMNIPYLREDFIYEDIELLTKELMDNRDQLKLSATSM
jgi:hypothetical protein